MNSKNSISNAQRTGILITLLAAAFITSMSTTVTANMIPDFTEFFHVSSNLAQWLTSGATLISGITIPITAFLIKRIPNKVYFFSAMTAYTTGSLAAFFAFNFYMLLVSRLIQAVGCGMLLSFAQVVLLKLYPKEKHGTIMAAYSMAAMVSSIVGPTYAGLILDTFGWQGVFVSLFMIGILIIVSGIVFLTVFSVLQLKSENPMLNLRVFRYPSFRIAVLLGLCMYLICMGTAMVLPIFTKSLCGYSDTAYGVATIFGSILSAVAALSAGKLYDKLGVKPIFIVGTGLFAVYSIMGLFLKQDISIVYIAVVFALQTVAMSSLNSPTTAMALSGLEGKERVDGSAIFNTLRQISSSLASMLAVLIFTLTGSDVAAVHSVYRYFLLVTIVIAAAVILYLRAENKK